MHYIRLALFFMVCCAFTVSVNAQGIDQDRYTTDLVLSQKAKGSAFIPVTLFDNNNAQDVKTQRQDLLNAVEAGTILTPDPANIHMLREREPYTLTLQLPSADYGLIELELVRISMFTADFKVVTDQSHGQPVDVDLGVHYRGTIKNVPNSTAAVSVFGNEVMGIISSDNLGNMILGKLDAKNKDNVHIFYNDADLKGQSSFSCAMPDDNFSGYTMEQITETADEKSPGDCLRIYLEVGNDINANKGGVTGATNYITALFNETFTLYANESIPMAISQIFVWTTNDPYTGSGSSANLSTFQSQHTNRASINNADLGQFVNYDISGGVAAGFSGVCASNVNNSLCVSGIQSSYNSVPTYSWSVMVTTHEMGHLIGSRHTHACVWNGNNTAIDGCSGQTEGSCSLPGNPSGGGTIMSYCHLQSVGINFNLGFGSQPGAVIRSSLDNATCTSACGPPSCTDGIQNQDETGVDCGGATCPACPTCSDGVQNGDEEGVDCGGSQCAPCPCNGTEVTLTINLDNYPEETSWDIQISGSSTVVASGGTYGSQPDGSQVVELACLADGCYDFTIYDAYGDGICCSYGIGDYTLADGATVLASGGAFGSSESTAFCLSSGPPPVVASISSSNDASCNGGSDGSAVASASGGTPPYNYSWSNGQNGVNLVGVSAGSYTVVVTDANSGTDNATVVIGEPSAVTVSASGTDSNCPGADNGTASASASGGTGSINYSWSGPGGFSSSSSNISGLAPGTYTVVATDANGCTANDSVVIGESGTAPTWYADSDSDGYGNPAVSQLACTQPEGYVSNNTDCNDGNGSINPGATEVCDGVDNNCDGNTDEGVQNTYYQDSDSDGYGNAGVTTQACSAPSGYVSDNTDCNDGNGSINPGAAEVCGDGVDNNCDGNIDEGCGGCTEVYSNFNNFNSSWGIWNDGGSDCRRSANDAAYAVGGTGRPVRLRDNTSSSVMTTDNINLSAVHELTVDFSFLMVSMETNEDFWLQVSLDGGANYQTVYTWANDATYNNNVRYGSSIAITITGGGTFASNTRVRFRCDASNNGDRVYIDDVNLSGCTNSGALVNGNSGQLSASGVVTHSPEAPADGLGIAPVTTDELSDMRLFPNPAKRSITVDVDMQGEGLTGIIMDITGRLVWTGDMVSGTNVIRISELQSGMYYMNVTSETGESITKKFVKAQ